jgi:hypothetical protein
MYSRIEHERSLLLEGDLFPEDHGHEHQDGDGKEFRDEHHQVLGIDIVQHALED